MKKDALIARVMIFLIILIWIGGSLISLPNVGGHTPEISNMYPIEFRIVHLDAPGDFYGYRIYNDSDEVNSPLVSLIRVDESILQVNCTFPNEIQGTRVSIYNDTVNIYLEYDTDGSHNIKVFFDGVKIRDEYFSHTFNLWVAHGFMSRDWHSIDVYSNSAFELHFRYFMEFELYLPIHVRVDLFNVFDGRALDAQDYVVYFNDTRITNLTDVVLDVGSVYNIRVTDYLDRVLYADAKMITPEMTEIRIPLLVVSPLEIAVLVGVPAISVPFILYIVSLRRKIKAQ